MLEKIIEKKNIKRLEYVFDQTYKSVRIYEATLYEIEHDLLADCSKEYGVREYGSIDAWKEECENKLKSGILIRDKYLKELTDHQMKLYKLNKK